MHETAAARRGRAYLGSPPRQSEAKLPDQKVYMPGYNRIRNGGPHNPEYRKDRGT